MALDSYALPEGTRIENYEIGRVLGVGGFGITYQARDTDLACDVAIKEYLPSGLAVRDGSVISAKTKDDEKVFNHCLERFLDEARTLAKFRIPSIVHVNRYIQANGTAYIVMDYEDGLSLSRYLRNHGSLGEQETLSLMIPILEGLAAVHEKNVLHRDIKPSNIYLRRDGGPILLDFGAARQALQDRTQMMTGMVTPGYAPFEQYNNRSTQGPWTDIYGIGATMYHCITGKAPMPSPDRVAATQDNEPDPLPSARELAKPDVSQKLISAIEWMLQVQSKDRPQKVSDVLEFLKKISDSSIHDDETVIATSNEATVLVESSDGLKITWAGETLAKVEKDLAKYMGPMARVLVKKESKKTNNLSELYEALAGHISEEKDKKALLKKARKRVGQSFDSTTTPSSTGNPSTVPSSSVIIWDEETLRNAEKELAKYVGPLAGTLVKKAAQRTSDMKELLDLLAEDIPSEQDKSEFISRTIPPRP